MNQSKPEEIPVGGNGAQPKIYYDLGAMLKANPLFGRIVNIIRVNPQYLGLELMAVATFDFARLGLFIHIQGVEAVDYSIRPPNAAILGGGPLMEFHEQHPLLENVSQIVPNTDGGKIYDPPVKFCLLKMDQSYIIAGQFALRLENVNGFNHVCGLDEQQRQQRMAALKRGLEWMEPFRLPKLMFFRKTDYQF